jgi:hypothetical protein
METSTDTGFISHDAWIDELRKQGQVACYGTIVMVINELRSDTPECWAGLAR